MYEYGLEEVFEELNRREFARYDSLSHHFFSIRHRLGVRKILYQNTKPSHFKSRSEQYRIPLRRKLLMAAVIIFLAVLTGAVTVFRVAGFSGTVYTDNTHMFALNDPAAPQTIEQIYFLEKMPGNYEYTDGYGYIGDTSICRIYTDLESGNNITLLQYVKSAYNSHFDNEHSEFAATEVNGHNAFIWQSKNHNHKLKALVWDNGDYILAVSGKMNKENLEILAKSAKTL